MTDPKPSRIISGDLFDRIERAFATGDFQRNITLDLRAAPQAVSLEGIPQHALGDFGPIVKVSDLQRLAIPSLRGPTEDELMDLIDGLQDDQGFCAPQVLAHCIMTKWPWSIP